VGQVEGTRLPRTRIATIFIWLNSIIALCLVLVTLHGFAADRADESIVLHVVSGLAVCIFGLGGIVAAMFYLVTTGAAVKEAVVENELPKELYYRTAVLKKKLFPWCMAVIVLLICTTIIGGAVHTGMLDAKYHMGLAILTALVYLKAIARMKSDFLENRLIMANVLSAIDGGGKE